MMWRVGFIPILADVSYISWMDTPEEKEPRKLGGLAAELIVAAQLVEHGWNIYSPHVDEGFDFIAVLPLPNHGALMRPVQVRGRYPEVVRDRPQYGKRDSKLSQIHDEMVFALPYFKEEDGLYKLVTVSFLPKAAINLSLVRKNDAKKIAYYCTAQPAQVKAGVISARRDYERFFDGSGIRLMARADWKYQTAQNMQLTPEPV